MITGEKVSVGGELLHAARCTIRILNKLESSILTVASWFTDNCMRLNRDKCHFMVFGDQSNDLTYPS